MRTSRLALATLLGVLVCTSARAEITLDFANNIGGTIKFTGGGSGVGASFSFTQGTTGTGSGYDFQITNNDTGRTGSSSALGLNGNITGTYSYTDGSITTSSGTQSAPLTGTGTFSITDANSVMLTATVAWINIQTSGTGGTINATGTLNLTSVAYTGTNADLLQLKNEANGGGVAALTFQFTPAQTLTSLETSTHSTSYSGTLTATATPEPTSIALALAGLPVLGVIWARRRRQRA
jgi:hypothetical protein